MRAMMGALRTAAAGAVLAALCNGWAAEAVGPSQSPQVLMRSESREPATNSKGDGLFNETPSSVADPSVQPPPTDLATMSTKSTAPPGSVLETAKNERLSSHAASGTVDDATAAFNNGAPGDEVRGFIIHAVAKVRETIAAGNDLKVAMLKSEDTVQTAAQKAQDSINAASTVVDNALASGADKVGDFVEAVVEKAEDLTRAGNALKAAMQGQSSVSAPAAEKARDCIDEASTAVTKAREAFDNMGYHTLHELERRSGTSVDAAHDATLAAIEAFRKMSAAQTSAVGLITGAVEKAQHAVQGVRALQKESPPRNAGIMQDTKQSVDASREAVKKAKKEFLTSKASQTQAYDLIGSAVEKCDAAVVDGSALEAAMEAAMEASLLVDEHVDGAAVADDGR